MSEITIIDKNNKAVGTMQVSDEIFAVKVKDGVVYEAIRNYRANQRQGTHATKTKGQVRGGGKKPWRQKGTGRARAGSNRSPLWTGGGITFGPQPRDYSYAIPKKARRHALRAVLSEKYAHGELTVINTFQIEKPRTKDMIEVLKNLECEGKSTLIVLSERDNNVMLSSRNIPGVTIRRISDLNPYEAAVHSRLLMTKDALELMTGEGKK
jgi:large subunit ribosomal protein L4